MRDLVKRLLLKRAAGGTLRELSAVSATPFATPVAAALSTAVRACLDPASLDASTAEMVHAIEAIRRRNNGSDEEIQIVDYGAGPPNASRTESEMRAGSAATITLGQACRASKPFFWSLFLFYLVREVKPRMVVELGTCLGLSAAYQAAGLSLNGSDFRIVTLEGAPELAERSRGHFEELALAVEVVEGSFQTTFEPVLKSSAPIDLLFVDGHHDEQATLRYFREARPFLSADAWVVFDDIDWSEGMRRAWAALEEEADVDSVDLGDLGLIALRSGSDDRSPESERLRMTERLRVSVPKHLVRYARPPEP